MHAKVLLAFSIRGHEGAVCNLQPLPRSSEGEGLAPNLKGYQAIWCEMMYSAGGVCGTPPKRKKMNRVECFFKHSVFSPLGVIMEKNSTLDGLLLDEDSPITP